MVTRSRRRRLVPAAWLVLLLLLPTAVARATDSSGDADSEQQLRSAVEQLLDLHDHEAEAVLERLVRQRPDDPRPRFFLSQVYFWRYLIDLDSSATGSRFQELSELAIKTAKRRLRQVPDDVDARLYLGRAYGNLSRYHVMSDDYLKAYWRSKKGKKVLKELLRDQPDCVDAELELGLYHYYAALAPRLLRAFSFLLGVEGDRQLGLAKLERTHAAGDLVRGEAAYHLQEIERRFEHDYEHALQLNTELSRRYPDNGLFLLNLADSQRRTGKPEQALDTLAQVLGTSTTHPPLISRARFETGRTLFLMNSFAQAAQALSRAISALTTAGQQAHWTYGHGRYLLGLCHELQGDRQQALVSYRKIDAAVHEQVAALARERIERPLTEGEIALVLVENHLSLSRYQAAATVIRQALARLRAGKPGYPASMAGELHYQLGRCLLELGEPQQAVSELQQAATAAPAQEHAEWLQPWTSLQLARCYRQLGDEALAVRHLDRAAEAKDSRLRLEVDRLRAR